MMRSPVFLLAVFFFAIAGCAELLPKSAVRTEVKWRSFDEARAMVEAIKPYSTTKAELAGIGLTDVNPAVTLLSHVEVAVRFPIGGVLSESDIDPGIRDCLKAGKVCTGYQLNIKRINSDRVGNFWLDAFRFPRDRVARLDFYRADPVRTGPRGLCRLRRPAERARASGRPEPARPAAGLGRLGRWNGHPLAGGYAQARRNVTCERGAILVQATAGVAHAFAPRL